MKYPNNPTGLKLFTAALRKAAPSIAFSIDWRPDIGADPIHEACDGYTAEYAPEWQAWCSKVTAAAIIDGETKAGSDYLSGTYERTDDDPNESNPFISGYLPDMIERALDELTRHPGSPDAEINAARQVAQACRLT